MLKLIINIIYTYVRNFSLLKYSYTLDYSNSIHSRSFVFVIYLSAISFFPIFSLSLPQNAKAIFLKSRRFHRNNAFTENDVCGFSILIKKKQKKRQKKNRKKRAKKRRASTGFDFDFKHVIRKELHSLQFLFQFTYHQRVSDSCRPT